MVWVQNPGWHTHFGAFTAWRRLKNVEAQI
jgi:hypothetical protein